ncbi:hypothetical protein C2845_PM11G12020 [Panicum miliaceum]|uniref:Uncharacterized protein n=1 Tax=Panicum miliaceum TaxID=4540 RepID=A0A3L6RUZ9_PANMI|nr:hypothetical protein C2845_PM11G12020 [Panicum miliaceum]
MPSPSLLLLRAPPPSPHLISPLRRCLASPSLGPTTRAPRPHPLRLPRAGSRATARVVEPGDAGASGLIPIARCYEGRLARLELAGAARREQAVAAAAAADGGAAAEENLAAGAEAMVVEAFLPGPDGGGASASSTRVILQAKEVKDKASKIKKQFGSEFFSENEPDSETMLAMAFKQVVMQRLSNFRLEVFSPGSERDFQDLGKPRKVSMDFSIISSDEKLLASLAEAIFSCVIQDASNNQLVGTGGLFQKQQLNCSIDSSVCIHKISEAEIVRSAIKCLESFDLMKSPQNVCKTKNGWWPAPNYESLEKIGGHEFVLWANEYIPTYRLQIKAKAFENTYLEGRHELESNRWEVLLTHSQLAELGNVIDMYFEDQFTLPGKTFHPHWNSDPSKIKKNNGYLNNIFSLMAGSCIILFVAIFAQLCWPRSLGDKRLFKGISNVPSSQGYCSDINSLDSSEIQAYCTSLIKKMKDSYGCPGDVMVDAHIGAWVGELPDCFKGINIEDNAASDNVQHPDTFIQENQAQLVPISTKVSDLEQNDRTQETLQNIASFQVVMSEEGKVVGFQPTNRPAVNHWSINPLATLLYQGRTLSPGILEPKLKISRPAKAVPIELLMSSERFSCSGDVMVDTNIGAWVGELPDCFMGINSMDSAASDDVQHLDGYILENQLQFVPTNFQKSCLEQTYTTQETLQNIASFQKTVELWDFKQLAAYLLLIHPFPLPFQVTMPSTKLVCCLVEKHGEDTISIAKLRSNVLGV